MRLATWLLSTSLALFGGAPAAQEPPKQTPPPFRSGVELIQLDVSVLDAGRSPVHGLSAADFTVLEEGQPRPIVAFTSVDLQAIGPAAFDDGPTDVASNALADGRLVIILLDQSIGRGGAAVRARRIATAAVDALATADLAAVVLTVDGSPTPFTHDRARLKTSILGAKLGRLTNSGDNFLRSECKCGVCSLEAIAAAAERLQDEPHRRKSLLFVGDRIAVLRSPGSRCEAVVAPARERMIRATHEANLSIHALDPNGLEVSAAGSADVAVESVEEAIALESGSRAERARRHEQLRSLAEQTGGRAVLNTNAPEQTIRSLLDETGSYYLLGFRPANPRTDGRYRRLTVRVNRPGAEVRTRSGYYAAPRPQRATSDANPLGTATRGLLPRRDLLLDLAAAPFAVPGEDAPVVLVTVGIRSHGLGTSAQSAAGTASASGGTIEVRTSLFAPDQDAADWHHQRLSLSIRGRRDGEPQYETLTRLVAQPGLHEVRAAVAAGPDRIGTVHGTVDVPDFARDAVTLSGILIQQLPRISVTPADALGGLVPVVPTTRRHFAPEDDVAAFVRVYQGRSVPLSPVDVAWTVRNSQREPVFTTSHTIAPARFARDRSADVQIDLPLTTLSAGTYLLQVDARRDGTTVQRQVRFTVR